MKWQDLNAFEKIKFMIKVFSNPKLVFAFSIGLISIVPVALLVSYIYLNKWFKWKRPGDLFAAGVFVLFSLPGLFFLLHYIF